MITAFTPTQTDELIDSFYPSGNIQEEKYFSNGIPANGWSRKTYYERGTIQLAECYSHSLIIEQLWYDEDGNLLAHKIYSHKHKELIDKPKQTVVERPNVVEGCDHMGYFFKYLPAISQFIEAEYDKAALEKAYYEFIHSAPTDDTEDEPPVYWGITGKKMRFLLRFERDEGYYQWQIKAEDERDYKEAMRFMERLD